MKSHCTVADTPVLRTHASWKSFTTMPSNDKQNLEYADSGNVFLVLQETEAAT